ncbi:MAG: PAS domain S-box protein [Planctomycetaceae bacterium]|nr:PAS domain S-box protein [Planctomycetaceae bacterium]
MAICNGVFLGGGCVAVSYLALKTFLHAGRVQVFLLGCGVLSFGVGTVLAGALRTLPTGHNLSPSLHNCAAMLAALFHSGAAFLLLSGRSPQLDRNRGLWAVLGLGGAIALTAGIALASHFGLFPAFYESAVGFTFLRQIVLASAVVLFGFSFIVFFGMYLRTNEAFLYWYSCALASTAVGLGVIFFQGPLDSAVGWTGRIAQYLGGIYFLVAAAAVRRIAQKRMTSLDVVLTGALAGQEEELQAAEKALQLREQEFHSLAEAMPQIVWATRPDGWNIYFNQQWVDYTGMTMEDSYGHGWNKPFHPDDQQRAWVAWQRATRYNEPYSLECRLRRADGVYRWWLVRGSPMLGPNGKILKWFGTCTDIEEIKRAEASLQEAKDLLEQRVAERTEALRRSEAKWNAAIENLGEGAIIATEAEQVIYWNPAARKMHGFSRPEEGIGPLDRTPETFELWSAGGERLLPLDEWPMRRIKRGETVRRMELRLRRPDQGWERIVSYSGAMVETAGGERLIFLSIHDLTEQRKAEEALRHSETRYRMLHETMRDAFVQTTMDGQIVDCNDIFCQMVGYTADEVRKLTYQEMTQEQWHESEQRIVRDQIIARGYSDLYEKEYRRKDGTVFPLELRTILLRDEAGRPAGMWAIIRDITARKQAEQQLREVNERLGMTRRAAGAGAWDWDIAANTIAWSPEMFGLFGVDPRTTPASFAVWQSILHPDDREAAASRIQRALAEHHSLDSQYRIVRPDNEVRWINALGQGTYDENGRPLRMAGICIDVTARRQAEEDLRRAKDELEQRVQERTAELAQRAEQLRALAGELTLTEQHERRRMAKLLHDHLQQLLVGAKYHTAILGRNAEPLLKEASREIEDLLDAAISESRSLTAELSPPILHEGGLMEGLEWLERWMADKHGLIVDLSRQEEQLPTLEDDVKILLFESVRELLFNAAKHAKVRSVNVDIRRIEGERLQVTVSDAGPGFDPSSLKKAGQIGAGFGLFSIQERLTFIGGAMAIDSDPGKGSRFRLTVPLGHVTAPDTFVTVAAPKTALGAEAIKAFSPKSGATIRVMLADDHPVLREGLARLLDEEPDIEIVGEAADGQAAIELANTLLPGVILMDMSMPKLNGIEATRAVHKEHPEIHIIGLSMYEQEEQAKAMIEAGATQYLTKSGPSEALVAAIRTCAAQRPKDANESGKLPYSS